MTSCSVIPLVDIKLTVLFKCCVARNGFDQIVDSERGLWRSDSQLHGF